MNNLVVYLPPAIFFAEDHITADAVVTETRPADFLRGKGESDHRFVPGLFGDLDA
jgi:hypothetical protein